MQYLLLTATGRLCHSYDVAVRRSAILTYHSVDDSGSVISTSPELFRHQMEFLATSGVPVVPLADVVKRPGSVAITFDDGFANLQDHAIPVLERYGLAATIFLVSDYCGGRNNWPSQPKGTVPDLPLMDWPALASLPEHITPGAHTRTHPNLNALAPAECERELVECRDRIAQRLSKPVHWLAYPYGASNAIVRSVATRHFDLAVGTSLDFLPPQPDRMNLPRIDMYYLTGRFPFERLFTGQGSAYILLRRLMRGARRRFT